MDCMRIFKEKAIKENRNNVFPKEGRPLKKGFKNGYILKNTNNAKNCTITPILFIKKIAGWGVDQDTERAKVKMVEISSKPYKRCNNFLGISIF